MINTLILLTSGVTVTWGHYAIQHSAVRGFFAKTLKLYPNFAAYNLIRFYLLIPISSLHLIFSLFANSSKSVKRFLGLVFFWGEVLYGTLKTTPANQVRLGVLYPWRELSVGSLVSLFVALYSFKIKYLFSSARVDSIFALGFTILLGALFTAIQLFEYLSAPFTIADGVFGSTFFLTTGFHGLHVLVGTLFLLVALFRLIKHHFTRQHHIGLESAIWYWHFVDVVWLCLYISIYHWGA